MSLLSDSGLVLISNQALGIATGIVLQCRLFTNNYTPVAGSTLGSFTGAIIPGYGDVTLVPANWSVSITSSIVTASYPQIVFNFTSNPSNLTVYGFYVVDTHLNVLVYAGNITPSFTPDVGVGGNLGITLSLSTLDG